MNTTKAPQAVPTTDPNSTESDSPPIAIQDRMMVAMFLIVGFMLGVIILMDLLLGFFR